MLKLLLNSLRVKNWKWGMGQWASGIGNNSFPFPITRVPPIEGAQLPFSFISARTTLKDALNFAHWLRDRYRCI